MAGDTPAGPQHGHPLQRHPPLRAHRDLPGAGGAPAEPQELQDETGGFLAFIPLEYQLGHTKLIPREASAIEDLKTIAAARLLLDNFPHVKAYWVTVSEETASVALHFGANDMDGTIGRERIMHAAKAASPAGLARERVVQLIREAQKVPVERDALYNTVHVYEN